MTLTPSEKALKTAWAYLVSQTGKHIIPAVAAVIIGAGSFYFGAQQGANTVAAEPPEVGERRRLNERISDLEQQNARLKQGLSDLPAAITTNTREINENGRAIQRIEVDVDSISDDLKALLRDVGIALDRTEQRP